MSARERILAMVEWVRSGQGGYVKAAAHFRMTLDVVKKNCMAAGVPDVRQPRSLPERVSKPQTFNRVACIPAEETKLGKYLSSRHTIAGKRVGRRGLG